MRLIPDRVITEALYWMARAYERVHSMPRVSDTELASKIEVAKADLGRARDASSTLATRSDDKPGGAPDWQYGPTAPGYAPGDIISWEGRFYRARREVKAGASTNSPGYSNFWEEIVSPSDPRPPTEAERLEILIRLNPTSLAAKQARATEAERKLAEAVGLLSELEQHVRAASEGRGHARAGVKSADAARTFLSKEAERG